jgi:hypothetical protein
MSFSTSEQEVSTTFAAGQNIIVITMASCFLIQAYGARKTEKAMLKI